MPSLKRRPQDPEGRMSLVAHLKELRNRAFISAVAIVVGGVVGWIYYDELIGLILDPVIGLEDQNGEPFIETNFATSITQPFAVQLRVAVFTGVFLSAPVWIWQVWAFLLPGLRRQEKRIAIAYFCAAVPLFFTGAVLAGWALPRTVAVLLSFVPPGAVAYLSASDYLNFVLYFVVAFGIAFLLPVAMVGLNQLRIFPVHTMVRGWRVALLIILVFAALATPDPSAWTMIALAIPVFGLYWCAVGVSTLLERRRRKRDPEWLSTPDDEASQL